MLKLVPVARARVVDSLPDGIFVIDPAGTLVDVNLAGRALLADVRPDLPAEMVGRPAGELLRSPDLSEYLLGRQETGSEAIVRELRPGLHIAFQVITHYDERGRILAKVITTRDISAMVTAERELREHMATIDALRETLQEEAIRDALTGLHNRRHADAVLETAVTAQEPFVVLLLDVDHFKAVNDRYGHHGGDQVLRAISRVLGLSVRTGDVVARWGGEEFLVLLPGASLEGAIARAEQIRSACAQATQGPAGEGARRLPAVTVSVGVASFPACGSSGEKIVAAADAALYAAKAAGRNRVLTAPGAAPAAPATAAFLNA
jgi:diguanylate cyclase (GGDEF)-like protein